VNQYSIDIRGSKVTENVRALIEERAKWMHEIITNDCGVVSMETCRTIASGWALSDALNKMKWQEQLEVGDEQGGQ
jgi:hypothetical protein